MARAAGGGRRSGRRIGRRASSGTRHTPRAARSRYGRVRVRVRGLTLTLALALALALTRPSSAFGHALAAELHALKHDFGR